MKVSQRSALNTHLRDEGLKAQLATAAGRRFFWRIIEQSGAFGLSYTGEAASTFFAEGKRAAGLAWMVEAQRVASEAYAVMLTEALQERRDELRNQEQDEPDDDTDSSPD